MSVNTAGTKSEPAVQVLKVNAENNSETVKP
jgi:hypothetical protein